MSNSNALFDVANEIIETADIVEVISSRIKVTPAGRSFKAICPFHDDTNPSLMINREKKIYKCFVCGHSGNAITFIRDYEKISYAEAVREVAKTIGFNDERLNATTFTKKKINPELESLYNCLSAINQFYETALFQSELGKKGLTYLHNRHIDDETIRYFEIGYSLDDGINIINYLTAREFSIKTIERTGIGRINTQSMTIRDNNAGRVIFPIKKIDGQVVGFSARRINDNNDEAKYINTSATAAFNKGTILYNLHNAKDEARRSGYLYLLEGFMDVIALYRIGRKNAIALMGTALTDDHVKEIKKLNCEVRICLDLDNAGQLNTLAVVQKFDNAGVRYKIVNPAVSFIEKDSDEILEKYGKDTLVEYLDDLIEKTDWLIRYYSKSLNLSNSADKRTFIEKIMPEVAKMDNELDINGFINQLASLTGFDKPILYDYFDKVKKHKEANGPVNKKPTLAVPTKHQVLNPKDKLDRMQHRIVYFMLQNKDGIKIVQDYPEIYFVNKVYREISNALYRYIEQDPTEGALDINKVINYLNTAEVEDDPETIVDNISQIMYDSNKIMSIPPYSEKELNTTLKQYNKLREETKEKRMVKNSNDPREGDVYFQKKKGGKLNG